MTSIASEKGIPGILKAAFYPWIYLVGAAFLAALLAYPLFLWWGNGDISVFRTLVSRGGQVFLILGLFPIARRLKVERRDFGLTGHLSSGIRRGFLLGLVTLGFHGMLLVYFGIRSFHFPDIGLTGYGRMMGSALLSGVGVALLEETLFRGALIGCLMRITGPLAALIISAFDYAVLHFIGTYWTTDPSKVGWDTGFRIALDGFSHLLKADPSSLLALFMAGLLLGSARLFFRGGIGFSMGLHAGWVFIIKIFKPVSIIDITSKNIWMIGRYDLIIGYLSCLWLLVILIFILYPRFRLQRS